MTSSKTARAAIVYGALMVVLLVLLILVDVKTGLSGKHVDRALLVVLVVLYCLARFVVLPWWNSLSARRDVEGTRPEGSVQNSYVSRYIAAIGALFLALVVWVLQIHIGVMFPEQSLRQSVLLLMPALGSLLVSIAVVCIPKHEANSKVLLLISVLQSAVLFVFAIVAVFFAPAFALQTWYDAYTSEDYEQAVHPLWLLLPAVALLYRLVKRYTR